MLKIAQVFNNNVALVDLDDHRQAITGKPLLRVKELFFTSTGVTASLPKMWKRYSI